VVASVTEAVELHFLDLGPDAVQKGRQQRTVVGQVLKIAADTENYQKQPFFEILAGARRFIIQR